MALTLNVLFIGNSFTARNEIPGLIAKLAAAKGKELRHRLIHAGGASLRAHWNAGEALKAIQSGGYDYVVLQEQSTLPVKNAVRMHESVRLFDAAIVAAGSKTVLYMTWARRHAPETQLAITHAYYSIGRELKAIVVPAGTAWERFLAKHEQPVLHDRDASHPTPAGSYLAACAFFSVLFKQSPVGIASGVTGLNEEDESRLQRTAWEVCKPKGARGRK